MGELHAQQKIIQKKTGYLDKERSVSARDEAKGGGGSVTPKKYLEWIARQEEEYVRMTERTQGV